MTLNIDNYQIDDNEDLITKFEFLRDLPGIFLVVNSDVIYQSSNTYAAKMLGWKDPYNVIDKSNFQIPSKVSDGAELYIHCANVTMRLQSKIIALKAFHGNFGPMVIISEEIPLITKNSMVKGVFFHATDFTNYFLKKYPSLYDLDKTFIGEISTPKQYILTPEASPLPLSARHQEVLSLLIRGKPMKEIAYILDISPRTVEKHISAIKEKLGCYNKSQLIEKAIDSGFLFHIPETLFSISNLFK